MRLILLAILCLCLADVTAALAQSTYNYAPQSSGDHLVQGHFGHDGAYVPEHYEPRPKPKFRGYFETPQPNQTKKNATPDDGYGAGDTQGNPDDAGQ